VIAILRNEETGEEGKQGEKKMDFEYILEILNFNGKQD
jgi:hypothetical protein